MTLHDVERKMPGAHARVVEPADDLLAKLANEPLNGQGGKNSEPIDTAQTTRKTGDLTSTCASF